MTATNKHVRVADGSEQSLRYGELQRAVFGISQRMLTLTLKPLERDGLVKRTLLPSIPPRVDYELTPLGRSLVVPLRGLLDWSRANHSAMSEARRAHANGAAATSRGRTTS